MVVDLPNLLCLGVFVRTARQPRRLGLPRFRWFRRDLSIDVGICKRQDNSEAVMRMVTAHRLQQLKAKKSHQNHIENELAYAKEMASVNCSVYCRSNDDRTRIVFRSRRNISSDGASRTAADRLFNALLQSLVVR